MAYHLVSLLSFYRITRVLKQMNRLIRFTIKNFIIITLLPILCILLFRNNSICTLAVYIYGMLLYGYGRAVGQGMYFQTKQNKPIPPSLIDTVKSAKYHTFTMLQAIGTFIHTLNIYFNNISKQMFLYMICTSFIFYYFSYARVYNFIRGRQWYNKQSMYQVMILGKVRWISYPSKKISLFLLIFSILAGLIIILK